VLQRGRPANTGRPGPGLAYLTLQSLVIQHIRERQTRETVVEAADSPGLGDDTGEAGADATETKTGSLTVRELIQRSSEDDDGERGPTDDADAGDGRRAEPLGPTQTVLREVTTERNRDRSSAGGDADSVTTPDSSLSPVPDSGDAVDPTPSPGRGDSEPWTVIDAAGRGGDDGGARSSEGVAESSPPASTATQSGSTTGDSTAPPSAGPDLVVANRPPAADAGSDGDAGSGPDSQSRQRGERGHDGRARRRPDRRGSAEEREGPGASAIASDSSAPERIEDAGSGAPPPLSLDAVDRPTLDRFVERLSDELARHERVEGERRGL